MTSKILSTILMVIIFYVIYFGVKNGGGKDGKPWSNSDSEAG